MSPKPLVSVLMPSHNSRATLPMALASLASQTVLDWECILVDDGSSDDSGMLVRRFDDQRLRPFRLHENQGRPIAREIALGKARGKYLCMLDADDWYYPRKLEEQLEVLESNPDLSLLGTGMAIVDSGMELLAIRAGMHDQKGDSEVGRTFLRLGRPPISHATAMIRCSEITQAHFDPQFEVAEDVDFLLQVLWGRQFSELPEPLYAYEEPDAANVDEMRLALRSLQGVFWKHRNLGPSRAFREIAVAWCKSLIYSVVVPLGLGDRIVRRRSTRPKSKEKEDFYRARAEVRQLAQGMFETG